MEPGESSERAGLVARATGVGCKFPFVPMAGFSFVCTMREVGREERAEEEEAGWREEPKGGPEDRIGFLAFWLAFAP